MNINSSPQQVLVTGATGFLGRHTCQELLDQGYQVMGLGRNTQVGQELSDMGVQFIPFDFEPSQAGVLNELLQGVDYLVHCAALSSAWGAWDDFYNTNVLYTRALLSAAQQAQVKRFVHISTPSIYFDFQDKRQIREDQIPKQFVNAYAHTKYLAEQEVLQFPSEMEIIGIRPRAIFGEYDQTILPRILRVAAKGSFPIIGKGSFADYTYVTNVTHAIQLCLNSSTKSCGRFYNITNGQPRPIQEFLQSVFQSIHLKVKFKQVPYPLLHLVAQVSEWIARCRPGQPEPKLTVYGVGVLHFDQSLDITAARAYLNYQPQVSLEQGLKNFAQWYLEAQDE